MPANKISMREIAAKARVSVVAVSYALRGTAGVSAETRSKVLAIAESMGYRPDPLLSHLMYHLRSRRAPKNPHNIALLHWPKDSFRESVLSGARARAETHGYRLDVIKLTETTPTPRTLQRMLAARGVAGVVLGPSPVRDFTDLVNWERYAVVATSYSIVAPHFHRVVANQYTAAQLALQKLRSHGYQRVALLVPPWVEERINYFQSVAFTWEAAQRNTTPLLCYHDPELQPLSHLRQWFRTHRPDALVLCSPLDFDAVLCNALGPSTVAKLGIVSLGYDTQPANTLTVDYQPALLGSIAVDQLINQIHRGERGIPQQQQTLSVEGRLIDPAATLRPKKNAGRGTPAKLGRRAGTIPFQAIGAPSMTRA